MNTNIDMEQIQKDAVDIFNQGFACSESVIYAIRKHFEVDIPDEAIALCFSFRRISLHAFCKNATASSSASLFKIVVEFIGQFKTSGNLRVAGRRPSEEISNAHCSTC